MKLKVYTDGASRGNPGQSGAGVFIVDEMENPVASMHIYLGTGTNNEAEYKALLVALEYLSGTACLDWLKDEKSKKNMEKFGKFALTISGTDEITFFADSQLLVLQMQGKYSVKSPNILPLYTMAKSILRSISASKKFEHIPRTLNKEADRLANLAIDEIDA